MTARKVLGMGINLSEAFGVDKSKVENGTWVDVGDDYPELKGLRLLIARNNNSKAQAAFLAASKTRGRKIGGGRGDIDIDQIQDVYPKIASKHILLGWEGVQENDADGNPVDLPYSQANAERKLTELPEFASMVMEYAGDFDLFRAEFVEESSGNLPATSTGHSDTPETQDS